MTKNPSKSKTDKPSDPKETTAPSTTGPLTLKEMLSIFPPLKEDHPVFTRGWIVGERRSVPLSRNTKSPKPDEGGSTPRSEQTNLLAQKPPKQ